MHCKTNTRPATINRLCDNMMRTATLLILLLLQPALADDSREIRELKQQLSELQQQLNDTNRALERLDRQAPVSLFSNQDWTSDLSRFQFGRDPRPMVGIVMMKSDGEPGVRIAAVTPDGPADKAGIASGDRILSIDGENVSSTDPIDDVNGMLDGMRAGDQYTMTLDRDGEQISVNVTIEELTPSFAYSYSTGDAIFGPGGEGFSFDFDVNNGQNLKQLEDLLYRFKPVGTDALKGFSSGRFPGVFRFGWQWAGLELSQLNPDLAEYFSTSRGVLVIHADLDDTRLKGGDVILSVSGDEVDTPSDVMELLTDIRPGRQTDITVMRQGQVLDLTVTAPERIGSGYFYAYPDNE